MAGLIFFGCAIVVILTLALIGNSLERKRTAALHGVASQLRLQFVPMDDSNLHAGFARFQLFTRGRSPRIKNIAYGRLNDIEVMLFDYQYTTGSGKHKHTSQQTVCFFQSDALTLPEFIVRPEGMFDKIGQVFGSQDIDLPMHPEFSGKFILRGQDESQIRHFFTPDLVRFFEANSGISMETQLDRFILFKPRTKLKPEEWSAWTQKGMQACQIMQQKANR
jgi:hypothetical protein